MDALTKYLLDYILDLPDSELFYDENADSEEEVDNTSTKDANTDEILNRIGQAIQNSATNTQGEEDEEDGE